ncbi:MAG: hypothetical protein QXG00_06130 [Candidatus Woesearchaeota archaeon]
MNEILKTTLSFFASIITAYLIYIWSKKHDVKLEKRLDNIETDIKHIKHELEIDDTIETHIINLYKFLNYYYKKYINQKYIEIIDEIAGSIIKYVEIVLKNNMLTKDRAEQVEMVVNNLKDYIINKQYNIPTIDNIIEYIEIYKNIVIDIVFDAFNKKETRFVRETQTFIKCIFTNCYGDNNIKGVYDENIREN